MKKSPQDLVMLGAPDPEMGAIKEVLARVGIPFMYATVNGVRVHAGNAYVADIPDGASPTAFVECGFRDAFGDCDTMIFDHHKLGDFGFNNRPLEYWMGSSLGQVLGYLNWSGIDIYPLSPYAHLIAAADHCLAAAYRGECPGVDQYDLADWRAKSRAAFQGISVTEISKRILYAKKLLQNSMLFPDTGIVDMRFSSYVPELPEAACQLGQAFISHVIDRDGRGKVVLQSASPEQVTEFISGRMIPLHDYYGVPERGFAGGYVCVKDKGE